MLLSTFLRGLSSSAEDIYLSDQDGENLQSERSAPDRNVLNMWFGLVNKPLHNWAKVCKYSLPFLCTFVHTQALKNKLCLNLSLRCIKNYIHYSELLLPFYFFGKQQLTWNVIKHTIRVFMVWNSDRQIFAFICLISGIIYCVSYAFNL